MFFYQYIYLTIITLIIITFHSMLLVLMKTSEETVKMNYIMYVTIHTENHTKSNNQYEIIKYLSKF